MAKEVVNRIDMPLRAAEGDRRHRPVGNGGRRRSTMVLPMRASVANSPARRTNIGGRNGGDLLAPLGV